MIKFRAWDKIGKCVKEVTAIDWSLELVEFCNGAVEMSIDDVILMQSTGLKDKNGVEIYVGDIVRNDKGEIGRVVYLKQEAGFVVVLPKSDYRLGHRNTGEPYDVASGHEVIGTIYANPELLI